MSASSGLPYHERTIGAGAQTGRPVRDLLGGMASPAAFIRWARPTKKWRGVEKAPVAGTVVIGPDVATESSPYILP
jgi:hypothetical protein